MSGILKGMGGELDPKALQGMLSGTGGPLSTDAPLDKNKLQSIGASAQEYQTDGTQADPNMDFINNKLPLGNASGALSGYMNKTSTGNPELGYTYNPYEPEKIADLMDAQDSGEGTTGGEGDNSNLVTPSGTPMPGHPNYEAWMTAGGEGLPDHARSGVASMNEMIGNGYLDKSIQMQNNKIPGVLGWATSKLGKFNQDHYDKYMDKTFGEAGFTGDTGSADNDYQGSSPGDWAGGDGVDGGTAGEGDQGVGGMGGGAGDFGIFNDGGPISGSYSYGGPVAEQEDPYAPMPLAEPMQATPFGGPLRATPVDSSIETPWYQDVGQAAVTSVITSALTGMLPFNKGGMVCPCGTPGCPGCGKGYNHGGPIGSRVSYKEEIARKESAAKIKREDMKAVADVAVKMKGPLQQGV